MLGTFNFNSGCASKGNPSLSSRTFCIRNKEGAFLYVEIGMLFNGINLVVEVVALRLGLEYYVKYNILPLILETAYLSLKKILDEICEVP